MRTHGFVAVIAACLVSIASAQESVLNLPLFVASQGFVLSSQSAWEDICEQPLGNARGGWNKAKVTSVGTETTLPQDAHRLRVKFRAGDWIVTAIAPKGHNASRWRRRGSQAGRKPAEGPEGKRYVSNPNYLRPPAGFCSIRAPCQLLAERISPAHGNSIAEDDAISADRHRLSGKSFLPFFNNS